MVGVDGSPAARAALVWAARHAQATGAALHAVAVWQPQPTPLTEAPVAVSDADLKLEATGWLTDAADALPDVRLQTHLAHGDPAHGLVEYAAHAELLVVGHHGRGALADALLGSVAHRCARHARCPVALVPASPEPADQHPDPAP